MSPSLFRRNDLDRLKAPRTLKAEGGWKGGEEDMGVDDGNPGLSVLSLWDIPASDMGVEGVPGLRGNAKASRGLGKPLVELPGEPPSAYWA